MEEKKINDISQAAGDAPQAGNVLPGNGSTVHEKDGNKTAGDAAAGGDFGGSRNRRPLWIDIFAIIGVFLASALAGAFVALLINKTANADIGFAVLMGYITNFLIPIFFAVWLLKGRKYRAQKPKFFRFSMRKVNPSLILWGFLLLLITSVVLEPVLSLFPETNIDRLLQIVDSGGWAILMLVIAAPVLEEIFFRGIIQEELANEYGGMKGVLMAAAFFGLAHIQVPQQAVNAFFVGIILGYIYVKTKSLVPVMLIHAMNNAIAYLLMLLFRDNIVFLKDIISNRAVYYIIYALCVAVFIFASVNVYKEIARENKE